MVKTRKSRMRKKFQYNKNRKREWKKSRKLPTIKNVGVKSVWQEGKSIRSNLRSMGLVEDPNKLFKITSKEVGQVGSLKRGADGNMEVDLEKPFKPANIRVREAMEADAKELRQKSIALSRPVAEVIGYMLSTHGDPTDPAVLASKSTEKSILLSMVRDKRNFDQLTPKQIKRKILAFKRIPEYVEQYYTNRPK